MAIEVSATLTSKCQLTMPKQVRERLGLKSGDTVCFVPSRSGYRIVPANGDITRLKGIFKGRRETPLSIEDMNLAIGEMGLGAGPAKATVTVTSRQRRAK